MINPLLIRTTSKQTRIAFEWFKGAIPQDKGMHKIEITFFYSHSTEFNVHKERIHSTSRTSFHYITDQERIWNFFYGKYPMAVRPLYKYGNCHSDSRNQRKIIQFRRQYDQNLNLLQPSNIIETVEIYCHNRGEKLFVIAGK